MKAPDPVPAADDHAVNLQRKEAPFVRHAYSLYTNGRYLMYDSVMPGALLNCVKRDIRVTS